MKFTLLHSLFLPLLLIPLCWFLQPASAQEIQNVQELILMKPTGQSYLGVPLLEEVSADNPQRQTLNKLVTNSFIREMIHLNGYIQESLVSRGLSDKKEPMYLLASGRMGGFPMHGFFLKKDGKVYDKREVPYVDLAKVEENYRELGSITQIYPHEVAHTWFMQFSGLNPNEMEEYSSDIHYFSMTTNYFTAFNEGFAESFENISRLQEKDAYIIRGTASHTRSIERYMENRSEGFDRDYRWPLRMGFYRMTMVAWYQALEDYKRYKWALNSIGQYQSLPFSSSGREKSLMYRNACVMADTGSSRNIASCLSTEGVVNSFFTLLMESPAKYFYPPDHSPLMSPVENQLMKEFSVISNYLGPVPHGQSCLQAFISGYIREFPQERKIVLGVFKQATGLGFTETVIPELWVLNKDHHHGVLVMAQYGGCDVPFYTMNLNTAGIDDLMTFKEVSPVEAEQFVIWRDSAGLLKSYEDLDHIPGSLENVAKTMKKAKLDPVEFNNLETGEGLTISGFLVATALHFLWISTILIISVTLIQWFFFYFKKRRFLSVLLLLLRNFFKVILFLAVASGGFLLPYPPLLVFTGFIAVLLMVNLFSTRNNPVKRREVLLSSLLLFVSIGYSLI
jgi:hypothetical protein